ncbi:hypothetical protein ACFYPZ_34825 [Streptomyces sp. NPDC005506]
MACNFDDDADSAAPFVWARMPLELRTEDTFAALGRDRSKGDPE